MSLFYRYDEDEEDGLVEDEEDDSNGLFLTESTLPPDPHELPLDSNSLSDSDEEEDDEVLEIRSTPTTFRPRPNSGRSESSSSSSGSSRSRNSVPLTSSKRRHTSQHIRYDSSVIRTPSSEKELITIAPIAPTILKTKGVGNGSGAEDDDYDYPLTKTNDAGKWYGTGADVPVHLVYVPPIGGDYRMDGMNIDGSPDVYQHREAYFSVGSDTPNGNHVPSAGPASPADTRAQGKVFLGVPAATSLADDDDDAYDYFSGPDLGDAFTEHKQHSYANRREMRDDDSSPKEGAKVVEYAEGGAASVVGGRSSGKPQVVVDRAKGALEDGGGRERSRSRSRSRTPSPSELTTPSNAPSIPPSSAAVAVPGVSSSHNPSHQISPPISSSNNPFLIPPDVHSSRGRSAAPSTENQHRGRSATRGSSFSDRERSSSRGTNSPIGSISPEGSAVGIAIGSAYGVYANGRDRDTGRRGNDRMREHLGRQMNGSLSPDDGRTSSVGVIDGKRVTSGGSTTSDSSSSSTVTPTTTRSSPLRVTIDTRPPTIEEEQEDEQLRRSRQPTPASSPVLNMKASLPIQVPSPQPSTPSTTIPRRSAQGIVTTPPPTSATRKALDEGTLVGRAVEIAGAFLGSIWHGS